MWASCRDREQDGERDTQRETHREAERERERDLQAEVGVLRYAAVDQVGRSAAPVARAVDPDDLRKVAADGNGRGIVGTALAPSPGTLPPHKLKVGARRNVPRQRICGLREGVGLRAAWPLLRAVGVAGGHRERVDHAKRAGGR